MIGQMTGEMKPGPKKSHGAPWEKRGNFGQCSEEIRHGIDDLHVLSRRGLWRMLLFLVISAAALQARDFDLFGALPENIREILGAPPPPDLIHLVLVVSTLSALVLIAGRGADDPCGRSGWLRFWMTAFFYPLYSMSNSLGTWFPAVFAAGMAILLVEHFTVWAQTSRAIHEEKERLGRMA